MNTNQNHMMALDELFRRHPLPWTQRVLLIEDANFKTVVHLGQVQDRDGFFLTALNHLAVLGANSSYADLKERGATIGQELYDRHKTRLNSKGGQAFLVEWNEMPEDMQQLWINTAHDAINITSQRGEIEAVARVIEAMPGGMAVNCSECKESSYVANNAMFCPCCGARFTRKEADGGSQRFTQLLGLIFEAEARMLKCFHCGSLLKSWEPQVGTGPARMQTPFKWCDNCAGITFKNLAALMGIPDKDTERFINDRLPQVSL